jgi:hypothetical protein
MKRMFKHLLVGFLFAAAGCSGTSGTPSPSPRTSTSVPTTAARITPSPIEPTTGPTATPAPTVPTATSIPTPQSTTASLITSRCSLLNSHDLASLYPTHTEVMLPTPQVSQVNHVIFSTQDVSANEISCIYYVFYLPGSANGEVLQVNYWVDTPNQATPAAWAKIWDDANSQAAQSVSGIGDSAFYENGKMTFKKGDIYVTIEVVGTSNSLDTNTSAGVEQQIKIEKQIAQDALKNF